MTSRKTKPTFSVKLLSGNKEVATMKEAVRMLISPFEGAPVIDIGDDIANKDRTLAALTFAQDHYRFHRYSHPMTNFALDEHVYLTVGDSPYVEDGAVVGPASPLVEDGLWHYGDIVRFKGERIIRLGRALDPVNNITDVLDRTKKASAEKREAALDREFERFQKDYRTILKHEWGQYDGCAFSIRIAYMRDRAEETFKILTEPNDQVAWDMRNFAITGKQVRSEFVTPEMRHFKNRPEALTDTPDFAETEKPTVSPEALTGLVMPFVKGAQLTGKFANLAKVAPASLLSLFVLDHGKLFPARWERRWDPEDESMVKLLQGKAVYDESIKGYRYAVEFSQDLNPEAVTENRPQ